MQSKNSKNIFKIVSFITLITFIFTNTGYPAVNTRALRPPMAMGTLAEDGEGVRVREAFPMKMISGDGIIRHNKGKVVAKARYKFDTSLEMPVIETGESAPSNVKKAAAIHNYGSRQILSKYKGVGFVSDILNKSRGWDIGVEFVQDNDMLMDIAPASDDMTDPLNRVISFDLDVSDNGVIDIDISGEGELSSKDPEILLGMAVLSALGQFYGLCHLAGMGQQEAIETAFDFYNLLSSEEKTGLDKVLSLKRIDGSDSLKIALKTQADYEFVKEAEGWDIKKFLSLPNYILVKLGTSIAKAENAGDIQSIIDSDLLKDFPDFKKELSGLIRDGKIDEKEIKAFISNTEHSLKWKEQWALWLIVQELIDIPYDQKTASELLRDEIISSVSQDIDESRRKLQEHLRNTFDDAAEAGNITRISDTMREDGVLLICGRVSRAFGNQMMLLSNSKEIKDASVLQDITLELENETRDIPGFYTSIERFKNLVFSSGKQKRVFVTQLRGAIWHMRRNLREWQKEQVAKIDKEKEENDRKTFGRQSDSYFQAKRDKLGEKFKKISNFLDRYENVLASIKTQNASFLVLQQRFFPGESQRVAQLNYGQDAFPGKMELLRDLFRTGTAFRYATPGLATVRLPDGRRATLSWLEKADHWVEAIPMFIKERIVKYTDENGNEKEEIQTEVDQQGMEAFFRSYAADEWAKGCEEVEDSEHIALARGIAVRDLLDRGKIHRTRMDGLSKKFGKEEAYRKIIIETNMAEKVGELAAIIGKEYSSHIEEVFLYREKHSVARIDAVRDVIIGKHITADSRMPQDLKDRAAYLSENAYKKRRPVATLHVLTTESAGMTRGFAQTWIESEMSFYNIVKANGWEKEVQDRIAGYRKRLETISRKVIKDFGMWSEVEAAKIANGLKPNDDAIAINIVIGSNRVLANEVAKLATLIEFYERKNGTVDLNNSQDPDELKSYIENNKPKLEKIARQKVVEFNGKAIEDKIKLLTQKGMPRDEAEVRAIQEDKDFTADFNNFMLIEARDGLLEELNMQNTHLGLIDKSQNYIRNHTSLAKSWARRETIASHKAQALTEDLRYKYTATGAGKRYNLVYGPSRVDLGSEEFESVVRWPQWVGAIDTESADSAREFYNQINEAGVVVRPWLEWQEIQKTSENASMTAGKAFANMLALTAKAVGIGDGQWLMDQMSMREDKDRGTPSPSEGYAGYCVPKDGLFLAFVLSLANERKLEQINQDEKIRPVILKLAREALLRRNDFGTEFEWEMWVAKNLLSEESLANFTRQYIDVKNRPQPGLEEKEILVFNLTKLAKVIGNFGKPWEQTATGARMFDSMAARAAQKIAIEGSEQIQRYMVSEKVTLIRRALKAANRLEKAVVVFAAEYKKVMDIRFSAGLRKLEMLAKFGEALPHQFNKEQQALYYLDELGFTSMPKLRAEKEAAESLIGDEKKRRILDIEKRMIAAQLLYDNFRLADGQDDEVIGRFENEFQPAAIPKDIRITSVTMASTQDMLHYYDDTQLEQISDVVAAKLSEYGLKEDQMAANAVTYGGDLERWAIIKDLPEPARKELLSSKVYITVKGESYEYSIQGAIHALVLKLRGPYRSYLDAIQGADVVDFGIDFPELLEIAYNYPKFVQLMLAGNLNSALVVSDTGVGRINRSFTYEDVRMFFAACDNIAGKGRGNYVALDLGDEVVKYLRSEMAAKRDRSSELLDDLNAITANRSRSEALARAIEKAENTYYLISEQIKNSNEAEEQIDEADRIKRYKRFRERDDFITQGLSRINQGIELANLDFGTWLTLGGRYLIVGKSEKEISAIRARFDGAMTAIAADKGAALASNQNIAVKVSREEENKVVKALALPMFIPEAQKFVQEFGKEGSSKATETSADRALERRQAYRLKEIRFRAFAQREDAFKESLADAVGKNFGYCLDKGRSDLKKLHSDMEELFKTDDPGQRVIIRDRISRLIGSFLAYSMQGLVSIVTEIMPENTKEEKEAKQAFIKNIERLYSGREINVDLWRKINGGYRDPKGDFGRLAEAAKGDRDKLRKIAEAGIELFYTTLAIGQTAEFLQLEKENLDQRTLWRSLAEFFSETMYDHRSSYMPYMLVKGEGYKAFSEQELYAMAFETHAWLDRYFRSIYSNITDISSWTEDERDAFFGNFEDGKNIAGIGNNAPTDAMRRWRSYNTKRDAAFNMSDGFVLPVVFTEFDPEIINAGNRVNVLFLFPPGRTHISRAWREGPTMNALRMAEGKRGVNLIVNRYDEFRDENGEEPVLMNTSGYVCISKEEFVQALIKNKGYAREDAIRLAEKIERDDFIRSMMSHTKCSYQEAEKKALELQANGVKITKGITVAARFTNPVRSDNVIPYHGAELYDTGELERHRLPTTVQNLALSDVTYDKSIYGDIFEGSGVRLPDEINWRLEYEKGEDGSQLPEGEILQLIIEGVPGTPYIGLRRFSSERRHFDIVAKGAAESGARGLNTYSLISDDILRQAASFTYNVAHARSEGQNVTIQEALLMSPEVWASEGLLESFVDRQIVEWARPVKRETYPRSRIYATARGIISSSSPEKEYDLTHPIVLMGLQVATNVGRGGALECLLSDFIQPEYQEMVLKELKEKGSIVNKALGVYLRDKYAKTDVHSTDLIGRPYWWVPYQMNDFAFNIVWEKPGELVDVEPIYDAEGNRIGGKPILRDGDGNRFEGKIKNIELVLLEPNVGIGLWPNYSRREEALEWKNVTRQNREFDINAIGVSDRKVIENIGVIPGEGYSNANFGPDRFKPEGSGGGTGRRDFTPGAAPALSPVKAGLDRALGAFGLNSGARMNPSQLSVLLKYVMLEQAKGGLSVQEAIRNMDMIPLAGEIAQVTGMSEEEARALLENPDYLNRVKKCLRLKRLPAEELARNYR